MGSRKVGAQAGAKSVAKSAASSSEEQSRRRPTINDIARLASVSKKTVSRVINQSPYVREETRLKISSIIDELGFAPDPQARGLAFRRSFLIGLIYDNPNAQYIVNIQQGVLDGVRGSGYELVVHPCDRNSANFLSDVRAFVERLLTDGHRIIIIDPDPANRRAVMQMIRVLLGEQPDPPTPLVAE